MQPDLMEQAKSLIELLARGVEFAAAIVIGLASVQAVFRSLVLFLRPKSSSMTENALRLSLGRWLAVALELELAADILNTAVTPSWSDIGKLAAIAALRTALNFFLEREIREESSPVQHEANKALNADDKKTVDHPSKLPSSSAREL
jgi:uncharacterized membrane protein